MKFDKDHIGQQLYPENGSVSNLSKAGDLQQPAEETGARKDRLFGLNTKIAAVVVIFILLVPLTVFGYREYRAYEAQANSYYIPQPFTQKFDFREDTLSNGLKALYIKLNQQKEKVFVGNITSPCSRNRKRV